MICTCIQNKDYDAIAGILSGNEVELAEIRLDSCPLDDAQIKELFSDSDIPLVATCRIDVCGSARLAEHRLRLAVEAGARFADLEIEAPAQMSKDFQALCRENGTELIRSYHDFSGTPDDGVLQMALARCFRYGADIAKIVTLARDAEDVKRVESLYSVVLEGQSSMQGRLIAFCMGEAGRESRMECLRRGAPYTYAALSQGEATASGQWDSAQMRSALYRDGFSYRRDGIAMPASKSFAQRAILAAALAQGTSRLDGYSPCGDTAAAIALAQCLGAKIHSDGSVLYVEGIGAHAGQLSLDGIECGESGLLTRLAIPLLSVLNTKPFRIDGSGTLTRRPLSSAADIMASFGVLLSNAQPREEKEVFVPATAKGALLPGTANVPGKGGSQLISGLLMALPLCEGDSRLRVGEPRSIPYMYMTLDVLRHFGIRTRSEMEGDAEMLERDDWSSCSAIDFHIKGRQRYHAADFTIEGDWSAAANFLVAGAIFGSVSLRGLDTRSIQADISILDILVEAGAVVSELEDGSVCACKAPLEAFETDLNNAPDLFPITALLAAFCAGESRISGAGRLRAKESDRAAAIIETLGRMGVEAGIDGDTMYVCGESLASRILSSRLLEGGEYSSFHDHRIAMMLKVASIAAKSPIVIDDEACVGKSFPEFYSAFGSSF